LVLAESELETVPREITGHRQVVASARRSGKNASRMILDASQHHAAMRRLPDGARRGRPDLVHLFLLTAMESRAAKRGQVRVAVHTRNDDWIEIDPTTRLIRNYVRFCGLIEKLFETGAVPAETPLLTRTAKRPLLPALDAMEADRLIWLDETAPRRRPAELFAKDDLDRHVVAVIGGFPHGQFQTGAPKTAERVSLWAETLPTWTVAAELTVHYGALGDDA
jgi:rRNA small subunit pseudouridine methyltransferase Nep1